MIDTPWRWLNWTPKANWRSPESKYATMTVEEASALPVAELLAPGGCAWVWFTWPLWHEANDVVRAWGLRAKTGGAWEKLTRNGKQRMGTGFGLRSVCEPFVLAVRPGDVLPRGRSLRNLISDDPGLVLKGLAREHSRKPESAYRMAEALCPDGRRADIFSTMERPGWETFGHQRGKYGNGGAE